MSEVIQTFDKTVLQFIAVDMKNGLFDFFMPIFSSLGDFGIFWVVVCVFFLLGKRTRKFGIILGVTLLFSTLLGDFILKPIFGRLRPFEINENYQLLISKPWGSSFPSGHTLIAFSAAYIIEKANGKFGTISYVLAFLIAFSRIYLYVHYATDVLAGMIIGTAIGAFIFHSFRKIYLNHRRN